MITYFYLTHKLDPKKVLVLRVYLRVIAMEYPTFPKALGQSLAIR